MIKYKGVILLIGILMMAPLGVQQYNKLTHQSDPVRQVENLEDFDAKLMGPD